MVGQTLSHYRVLEKIGAGGMGVVYRANDTQLGRDVALKVLAETFTKNAERLARFEREARLLASLNHPHIATIHGLEESDGVRFLVMELVEGETLAERIKRSSIPIEEALPLFMQIAEALEAAHEKGIIHRDLKPANIKVTPEGKVKVLDFGLAKALEGETAAGDLSQSPTLTRDATETGVILGTAAYMSPEQARGKTVDKRTDIWAFGCVLYEALTGRVAFLGETVSDTIAAILEREPKWELLPELPRNVRRVLTGCLHKDPGWRLHDIADVRIELGASSDESLYVSETDTKESRKFARRQVIIAWGVAGLFTAISSLLVWSRLITEAPRDLPVVRSSINLSAEDFLPLTRGSISITPGGTRIVYSSTRRGTLQIYLRELDSEESVPIPGTEGGSSSFISPDGQWVGFFAEGKLKKAPLEGGVGAIELCDAPQIGGGSWGPNDIIFFSDYSGIKRVPASGGSPETITRADSENGEFSHRWPTVTPDGKYIIFSIVTGSFRDDSRIVAQSIATGERWLLIHGTCARFMSGGYLVYARENTLHAARCDLDERKTLDLGTPVQQGVDTLSYSTGEPHFAISQTGALIYLKEIDTPRRLMLVDLEGRARPLGAPPLEYRRPRFDPTGKLLMISVKRELYLYDMERESLMLWLSEFEDETGSIWKSPAWYAWSPDGKRIAFSAVSADTDFNIFVVATDQVSEPTRLTESGFRQYVWSWSPSGNEILFGEQHGQPPSSTYWDVYELPLHPPAPARPLLELEGAQGQPAVSPDGRWLAYASNESGDSQVYVEPFHAPGRKVQISRDGGSAPLWAPDASEIYYRKEGSVLAVSVTTQPDFSAAAPRLLFEGDYIHEFLAWNSHYDLSPDGSQFVMIQEEERKPPVIHLVLNWSEELKRLVPVN